MQPQYATDGDKPLVTLHAILGVLALVVAIFGFWMAGITGRTSILGYNPYSTQHTLVTIIAVLLLAECIWQVVWSILINTRSFLKVYPDHLEGCCPSAYVFHEVRIEPMQIVAVEKGNGNHLLVKTSGKQYSFWCGDSIESAYQLVSQMAQNGSRR